MINHRVIEQFLKDRRTFPQLAQTYYHAYFHDNESAYLALNDSCIHYFGGSDHETLAANKTSVYDLIDNAASRELVKIHDAILMLKKELLVFNEYVIIENKSINFLSIKAPLCDSNKIIGLGGVSFKIDSLGFSDFRDLINTVTQLFEAQLKESMIKQSYRGKRSIPIPKLTSRETVCLQRYMRGFSTKDIAQNLGLSNRTVEYYLDNIKSKLGVSRRSELLPLAFELYPELVTVRILK